MLNFRHKRHYNDINIPFYKGHGYFLEMPLKEKKRKLEILYNFLLSSIRFDKTLMIDEDATIDEAIIYVSYLISDKIENIEVRLVAKSITLMKLASVEYDAGSIPIKPFMDLRKDKENYPLIVKILSNLKSLGHPSFDDSAYESIMEYLNYLYIEEEEEEEAMYHRHDMTIYNKILIPYINSIPNKFTPLKRSEINKFIKKYPKWTKFINDADKRFQHKTRFMDIHQGNIGKDAENNGYIDLRTLFYFRYKIDFECPINHLYETHIRNVETGYYAEPYCSIEVKNDEILMKDFEPESKNIKEILTLYTNNYDCFRD